MSFAQGSRTRLALKAQPDFLTQATGAYLEVPYSTHSLSLAKQEIESGTSRGDREVSDVRHGQRTAAGQIACELRYGDPALELLMQSAMFNPWASNEVTIGTSRTFLSIEDSALDIGRHRMFTGMEVNRMALSIKPNQMATVTFEMSGRDMIAGAVSGAGAVAAPTANVPMDSFSGGMWDQIPMSGQELNIVTSIDLTLDNGIAPTAVTGDSRTPFAEFGRGRLTGSLTAYWNSNTFLDRFLNEVESPLLVQVADPAGNDYLYYLPRVKYNGADVPHASEQSRMMTLPFRALKPASGAIMSALRIQR